MRKVLTKDFVSFLVINLLVSLGLGIFLLVFNLHIITIINSKVFLGNFMFLGNISMAIGGMFLGKYIDLFPKKRVLLLTIILCSVFFGAEVMITNQYVLYIVSIFYGLSFSVFMTIGTPFILEYVENDGQKLASNILSSVKLLGTTLGTWIAGIMASLNSENYLFVLLIAFCCYGSAIIPAIFIKEYTNKDNHKVTFKTETEVKGKHDFVKSKYMLLAGVYFCLGLLIFLSPYMNLYLKMRFKISILLLSGFLTVISVIPILTNIILAKLTEKNKLGNVISVCLLIISLVYIMLFFSNNLYIQLLLILISSIITSFVFPLINIYIIKQYAQEYQGKISGHVNFWYNAGDSMGTYSEGVFLANHMFKMSFGIASLLYILTLILINRYEKKFKI